MSQGAWIPWVLTVAVWAFLGVSGVIRECRKIWREHDAERVERNRRQWAKFHEDLAKITDSPFTGSRSVLVDGRSVREAFPTRGLVEMPGVPKPQAIPVFPKITKGIRRQVEARTGCPGCGLLDWHHLGPITTWDTRRWERHETQTITLASDVSPYVTVRTLKIPVVERADEHTPGAVFLGGREDQLVITRSCRGGCGREWIEDLEMDSAPEWPDEDEDL